MTSSKYNRDFFDQKIKERPGRINPMLFNYSKDAGGKIPGLQWMLRKLLSRLGEFFVIEGCIYDETNIITNGFIFMNGKVLRIRRQNGLGTLVNGSCIYIGSDGIARKGVMDNTILNSKVITAFMKHGTVHHCNHPGGSNGRALGGNINVGDVESDSISLLPIGTILMYNASQILGGDTANITTRTDEISESNGDGINMSGWYVCNGQSGTPNLQEKFIRCENDVVGHQDGSDTVTLTTNQIPSHNHIVNVNSDSHNHTASSDNVGGSHLHSFSADYATGTNSVTHRHSHNHPSTSTSTGGNHYHTFSSSVASGGNHYHTGTTTSIIYYGGTSEGRAVGTPNAAGVGSLTTNSSGSHNHSVSGSTSSNGAHQHRLSIGTTYSGGVSQGHTHSGTLAGNTDVTDISHKHTVSVDNNEHNHAVNGGTGVSGNIGGGAAHENRPLFRSTIFITRIS